MHLPDAVESGLDVGGRTVGARHSGTAGTFSGLLAGGRGVIMAASAQSSAQSPPSATPAPLHKRQKSPE